MCRDYRASSCSADLDKLLNIDLIKPQNKISEYLFYICRWWKRLYLRFRC